MATDVEPDKLALFNQAVAATKRQQEVTEAAQRGDLPRTRRPKSRKLYKWVDVPDYEDFQFYAYINFPQRLLLDIQSGEDERSKAALRTIILEHNEWEDEEGNPYPPAQSEGFWEAIPTHLAIRIIRAINLEISAAPLAQPQRNS
jgi:hypothetical protein